MLETFATHRAAHVNDEINVEQNVADCENHCNDKKAFDLQELGIVVCGFTKALANNLPTREIHPADKSASFTRLTTKNMLIPMTTIESKIAMRRLANPFAKSPMMSFEEENAIVGIVANGS